MKNRIKEIWRETIKKHLQKWRLNPGLDNQVAIEKR